MKKLFSFLLPLLWFIGVSAQTYQFKDQGFPPIEQLLKEGRAVNIQAPIYSVANSGTINFGTQLLNLQYRNVPGRSLLVTSMTASSTGPAQAYSNSSNISKNLGGNLLGQAFSTINATFGTNGGVSTVNPRILVGSEGLIDIVIKYIGPDTQPRPYVGACIDGIEFTTDYHWDAKKVIGVIGESTSWSAMENDSLGIAFAGEKLWCFQVVDSMRRAGKSVRLVNKAYGSMSSNHMEYSRRSGYYDFDYDLLIVNLGQNDANTASSGLGTLTPEATYKSNLANIIKMRNTHRPRAPVIFVSCYPTDVATIGNYRTWMQQVAQDTTLGGGTQNDVYFFDGSAAFTLNVTATADINFAITNRSAGNRIHYSGYGMTRIANYFMSLITPLPIYSKL